MSLSAFASADGICEPNIDGLLARRRQNLPQLCRYPTGNLRGNRIRGLTRHDFNPEQFCAGMGTPTRRIRSPRCARAPSGHAAAAPPSSVMNLRRFELHSVTASQGRIVGYRIGEDQ